LITHIIKDGVAPILTKY